MMRRLRGGGFQFDIVGRARLWFVISAVIMLVSIGSLAVRKINAGLEFRGGTSLQVETSSRGVTVQDVRAALGRVGIENESVQKVGGRGFLVQTEHLSPDKQREAARALAGATNVRESEINVTDVGPKWGAQITSKAVRALIIFLVVVVIYLSIRLEPKMAGAAFVALVHDVVATAGIYSLTGFEVTPSTVIALLTILGYSLYDTVVIFDRLKERTAQLSAAGRVTYSQAANGALNQVLVRSLNTSIVSLLPVGSLLFIGSFLLGAQTLRELALALFIGISVGTYSSSFLATPLVALWKEREQRWSTLRARIGARAAAEPLAAPSRPPVRATTPAPAPVQPAVPTAPPAPSTTTAAAPSSTPSRPAGASPGSRQKRRKKRKRRRR